MADVGWRNRIVGSGAEEPGALVANPRNWRIHPDKQRRALEGALDQVGWVQQVIVNRSTGFVVDGHLRVAAAISRGETAVPVVYVDLSEDEEALVLASLDPLSAMAGTDQALLAELLEDVPPLEGALAEFLGGLVGSRGGRTDPDHTPPVPATQDVYVTPGSVWELGRHRVACGDATEAAAVQLLLDGCRPAIMVTDPPYGVDYDPAWRAEAADAGLLADAARRVGRVENDDRADWREAWQYFPGDVAYVWHGGLRGDVVVDSLRSCSFELRSQIVWIKSHLAISRGAYHWRHEPCFYAVRKGATAGWIGDRTQTTVWREERQPTPDELQLMYEDWLGQGTAWEVGLDKNVAGGHSTQKPVECMERPLRNHAGDVFDPFVGSGTTVIAAERAGRRAFAMDIAPEYVQVTLERWADFTGQSARRVL